MTLMSLIRGKRSRGEGGNSLNENVRLQESAAPWKHDSHSVKDGKPNPTTSAHTILFLNVILGVEHGARAQAPPPSGPPPPHLSTTVTA